MNPSTTPSSRCCSGANSSSATCRRARPLCSSAISGRGATTCRAAFAAAEDLGADAYEMCVNAMPSWTKVGVETVGRCKGTLDAIKAADMLVCLHIPLFTRWLKEARDAGTRVLMVIDGPDELEELMAPPGLKEAVIHADQRLKRAKTMRITRPGRHRSHRQSRRISDHEPVRLFGSGRPLRPLGRGPRSHLPERRLGQRHGRVPARRHHRAAVLPLRAGRGPARHSRRLHSQRSKAGSMPS